MNESNAQTRYSRARSEIEVLAIIAPNLTIALIGVYHGWKLVL